MSQAAVAPAPAALLGELTDKTQAPRLWETDLQRSACRIALAVQELSVKRR